MRIEVHDAAELEFAEAVTWYDGQSSVAGDQFLEEFQRAIQRIAAFPNAWPKISKNTRRCRLNRFPYGVVYQTRKNSIVIVAVMHLHRRPDYWRDRLE